MKKIIDRIVTFLTPEVTLLEGLMPPKTTMVLNADGAFHARREKGKVVAGAVFYVERDKLAHVEQLLHRAMHAAFDWNDWALADRFMLEAIPELKGCGLEGIQRLDCAYQVLMQSHTVWGNMERAVAAGKTGELLRAKQAAGLT